MKKTRTKTSVASFDSGYVYAAIAGVLLYCCFAVYLYFPYLTKLRGSDYLFLANSIFAASGCFILSQRWTSSFPPRLFAGAVYGFGPFILSFGAFHPIAGVPLAALPWLFLPATYWKGSRRNAFGPCVLTAILTAAPFAAVGGFFWLCAQPSVGPFFPLPQKVPGLSDLTGLLAPLSKQGHEFVFGFCHVPLAAAIIGTVMYLKAKRFSFVIIAVAGLTLSLCPSIAEISPIVWISFVVLSVSLLIGLGLEILICCGPADCKPVLVCAVLAAALAATAFGFGFSHAAKMHVLSSGLFFAIAIIAGLKKRWHLMRWIIICGTLGFDMVTTSTLFVDKIF